MTTTPTDVRAWVGRTETVHDALAETQAQAVAAMLDAPHVTHTVGTPLPPLWHWFYFLPRAPQGALDGDGHPARGGFFPPIALPRRMFAGARVQWHAPLILGVPATRHGEILNVTHKDGKSGRLAFVTVRYRVLQGEMLCVEEEQDIVYREAGDVVRAPELHAFRVLGDHVATRELQPDSRLLFRFSALTFNAHRIHYDRPYALGEEGYPGLVVHGPLMALLLLRFAEEGERAHGAGSATAFSFRGLAPAFDTGPLRLCRTRAAAGVASGAASIAGSIAGSSAASSAISSAISSTALEAERSDGVVALRADAQFA